MQGEKTAGQNQVRGSGDVCELPFHTAVGHIKRSKARRDPAYLQNTCNLRARRRRKPTRLHDSKDHDDTGKVCSRQVVAIWFEENNPNGCHMQTDPGAGSMLGECCNSHQVDRLALITSCEIVATETGLP